MAIHPCNPLEDPYSLYPHSLRNIGEETAQWADMHATVFIFSIFTSVYFSVFSDELCASIVRSHRETSQYRVEELQALRWKLLSRDEIQAYQSKVNQHDDYLFFGSQTVFCICVTLLSLKTKHVISDGFDSSN